SVSASHLTPLTLPLHPPCFSFFSNDPPTTEIYTLSLHDALPICSSGSRAGSRRRSARAARVSRTASGSSSPSRGRSRATPRSSRSEEHTSELQSLTNLVCRLLLEKKKKSVMQLPHAAES